MNNKLLAGLVVVSFFFLSSSKKAILKIKNIVDSLPKSPTQSYSTRNLTQINKIVVHHSATTSGTAESYARYHVDTRGWPGIGYHFVIDQDGTINQTNWLETVSYHTGNENTNSIGICLTGNFDIQQPFPAQMASLNALISYLKGQLGQHLQVYGHRDYSTKTCPGDHISLSSYNPNIAAIAGVICKDGTYSEKTGRGACSRHGGAEDEIAQSEGILIPELRLIRTKAVVKLGDQIINPETAAKAFRNIVGQTVIEVSEHFMILLLSQQNVPIGYVLHSLGSINSTVVDVRLVAKAALDAGAVAIIIAHNHPSGNLTPSQADRNISQKLKEGLRIFEISLLDSMIITKDSYYSLADNGEL